MMQYVVYKSPFDYPGQYVVRKWTISGTEMETEVKPLIVTPDLNTAREVIPIGMYHMARWGDNDPAILEVWV